MPLFLWSVVITAIKLETIKYLHNGIDELVIWIMSNLFSESKDEDRSEIYIEIAK